MTERDEPRAATEAAAAPPLAELEALAADRRRGAAEIADALLEWCEAWGAEEADGSSFADPGEVAAALAEVARFQAAMAPILRISNDLLLEIERREDAGDEGSVRRAVGKTARSWRQRLAAAAESLGLHLRRAFESASTIYTYSASSTVRSAIHAHYVAGNWFQVVLSEARPGNEGAALARDLADLGVPVRFGTEAWLWSAMEDEGVFVVGSDALLSMRWVNKVGTHALAERARASGVPVVVAADTSKWLPPALASLPRNYDRDPAELVVRPPASMEVANPYFEEIPYTALDQLITERGPTRPRDLRSSEIAVARALQ